jgi:hypothetical protein
MVKDRLNNDAEFKDIELEDDVIKLLVKLREMSHSTLGTQEPNMALVTVLKRLTNLTQQKHDTISTYYQRFQSQAAVLIAQWGAFYPSKLAGTQSKEAIEAAQEAFFTAIFVANADNNRFRALKECLNNEYLSRTNNYPTTLAQAVELLTYNQDHNSRALQKIEAKSDRDAHLTTTSFAQTPKGKGKKKGKRDSQKGGNDSDESNEAPPRRRNSNPGVWDA